MTPDEAGALAEALPGVRRKGHPGHPAWYVDNRLVARLLDASTLIVRVPMEERDALLAAHPEAFGVPPRFEAHHKVEAYLDDAEPGAVRAALELAWRMQRR